MNTTFFFNIDDNRNTPSNISSVLKMVEVPTYKNNTNGKKYFFEINPSNKSKVIQSFIENDYKDFTIINEDGTPENYVNGELKSLLPPTKEPVKPEPKKESNGLRFVGASVGLGLLLWIFKGKKNV